MSPNFLYIFTKSTLLFFTFKLRVILYSPLSRCARRQKYDASYFDTFFTILGITSFSLNLGLIVRIKRYKQKGFSDIYHDTKCHYFISEVSRSKYHYIFLENNSKSFSFFFLCFIFPLFFLFFQ